MFLARFLQRLKQPTEKKSLFFISVMIKFIIIMKHVHTRGNSNKQKKGEQTDENNKQDAHTEMRNSSGNCSMYNRYVLQ